MAQWVIQHEFDNESTYIVDKDDEEQCIELHESIPWEKRLIAAKKIVEILNELE